MIHRLPGLLSLAAAVALVGCGPSPQPLPPPIDVVVEGLTISDAGSGLIRLAGRAGTAPSADSIDVVNSGSSSGTFAAAAFVVNDDGSFDGQVAGAVDDALRVQAVSASERSVPRDVQNAGDGSASEAFRVACALVTPSEEIDFGTVTIGGPVANIALTVRNDCATVTSVDESLLLDPQGWEQDLDGAVPLDLMAGGSTTNNLGYGGLGASPNYLRLLIIDGNNQREYRLITLRGQGQ